MARVDRLAPERKALLQAASVVGGSFHTAVLEEMGEAPGALPPLLGELCEARVPGALGPLPRRGVLVQAPADPGGDLRLAAPGAARGAAPRGRRGDREAAARRGGRRRRDARLPLRPGRRAGAGRGVSVPRRRRGRARRRFERGAALLPGGLGALLPPARRGRRSAQASRCSRRTSRSRCSTAAASSRRCRTSTARSSIWACRAAKSALAGAAALRARPARACCRGSTCRRRAAARGRRRASARSSRSCSSARSRRPPPTRRASCSTAWRRCAASCASTRAAIPSAGRNYAGCVGIFSYGGVSFGIGRRFLAHRGAAARRAAPTRPTTSTTGRCASSITSSPATGRPRTRCRSRRWTRRCARAASGRRSPTSGCWPRSACAAETSRASGPCSAASPRSRTGFGYQDARLAALGYQVYLLLEQGRFDEAVAAADALPRGEPAGAAPRARARRARRGAGARRRARRRPPRRWRAARPRSERWGSGRRSPTT